MKQSYKRICAALAAALLLTAVSGTGAAAEAGAAPQNDDIAADTLSSVGSVSKMYVTAAAMQLADQGKLDPDAPVTEYLPDFRTADPRYREITVRMLMNHRSGLMGSCYSDDILLDDRSTAAHDGLLRQLSGERLKADPGAYSSYCNDGFALLELVVEAVSGESFTDYLAAHIAKPLGLTQTGTPWDQFRDPMQVPVYRNKAEFVPDYCMTIGSGGVLSTAEELSAFGSAFFTGNPVLLSEQAKDAMRTSAEADPYEDGFGLGWDFVGDPDYDAAGVQVLGKGGDLVFQHAELLVAPDEEISIAVTSAGGSSSADAQLARALMDIALEEKGIHVTHSAPEKLPVQETVPDEYLSYAGTYATGSGLWAMTFPEQKYLRLDPLHDPTEDAMQFLYAGDGCFVQVYGNAETGNAAQPADSQTLLRFAERGGSVYLTEEQITGDGLRGYQHTRAVYMAQKADAHAVSAEAQAAWEARAGRRYYLCGDSASSALYADQSPAIRLTVPQEGYVNNLQIRDSTHAAACLHIPSSASRDQSDMEIRTANGREYLSMTDAGTVYLSESDIPDLPRNLSTAELTTGAALWYNIGSDSGSTVQLEIPARAAVYVYDQRDRLTYSSYMKAYGNTVPLPANGKIVFIGETGSAVSLNIS